MAKDNEMHFHSATINKNLGINAGFDMKTEEWKAEQDISQYLEHAKLEREKQAHYGIRKDGYRKLATIPDIVALDILQNHKLDLHDPSFIQNPANMTRLKKILMSEYPDLLVNI